MNPVSFSGAYHTNLNPQNNEKKNVKKLAAAAIVTTGVAVGGVALYKNRNSKAVQKAVSFAKDNVVSPLKKAGVTLKEKATKAINSVKTSVEKMRTKNEKMSNATDISDINSKAQDKTEILKAKIKVQPVKKQDIKQQKKINPDGIKFDSKKADANVESDRSLLDLAKKNADKLRTAAAGVTAGAVVGTGAMGVVDKINEKKELEDKKFIIKMNGKEFKGTFRGEDNKAHDEDGALLNGKVVVIYNGNFGKEYTPDRQRILKKTIMQYEDGVLKKATHFDDIDDKAPAHIKNYNNGQISTVLKDIVLNNDGKIAKSTMSGFGVKDSFAMMNTKKYVDENGLKTVEYYKRNEDEDGNIIGKPIHTFTTKEEKLGKGHSKMTFYSEPKKYGCIDQVLKTIETKPDGTAEITLMDRSMELENAVGKMTLGPDGKIIKYELFVPGDIYDPRSPDGVLSIQDGKIINTNDDMTAWDNGKKLAEQYPELDKQFGNYGLACYQDANLKMDSLVRYTYFNVGDEEYMVDESYVGKDGDTRVGIVHNEDGTIKAIAAYYGIDHHTQSGSKLYPDCVTFFENGIPVKDIHYNADDEPIFSPKYVF